MTQDEIKSRILGWCSQASEIAVVQDRDAPGADVALLLRLSRPEGARLAVLKRADDDRIELIHTVMFPPGSVTLSAGGQSSSPPATLAEAVERIVEGRYGSLAGSTRPTSDGQEVTMTSTIYADGLSKQAFLAGIVELTRVRRLIDHLHSAELIEVSPPFPQGEAEEPERTPDHRPEGGMTGVVEPATSQPGPALTSPGTPSPMPTPVPAPSSAERWAPTPVPTPVPVPSTPAPQPAPVAQEAEGDPGPSSPAPVPAAPEPFTASHRVPPSGMDAWAAPDPTQRAIARIDGGVPIQVTEVAGAWAHVLCSNGWTGWVDYRILVPAAR